MSKSETTETRWVWHDETFASLMMGRIQIAQVSQGTSRSGHWRWTLLFCTHEERSFYASPDKAVAMATAESHAQKVLAAEKPPHVK